MIFCLLRSTLLALSILTFLYIPVSDAAEKENIKAPNGGFEISLFLDNAMGFQHFNSAPITEIAYDGSFAGPLGEYLSLTPAPSSGQDIFGTFIPKFEMDITKRIGERVRLRADISFGRPASGSFINGIVPSHVYGAVRLTKNYNLEIVLGRFGLQAGYEPFKSYNNETVSWSIIWRAGLCPPVATGMQVSADVTDTFKLYVIAANGAINDTTQKGNNWPAFIATFEWDWGNEAHKNQFVLTPYVSADSGGQRPLTYGSDAVLVFWKGDKWKFGLEGLYQMNNAATAAGENTAYAAGLVNMRYRFTPAWYGVIKYVFARQFENGNGILNLTGTKQNIHESTLGFGYQVTDISKIKGEFRFDVINPDGGKTQYVPGAAFSYGWLF